MVSLAHASIFAALSLSVSPVEAAPSLAEVAPAPPAASTNSAGAAVPVFAYAAPPECPARLRFVQQVTATLGAADMSEANISVHLAAVEIVEAGGFRVNILFRPGQGTDRTLLAANCADAAAGAALIVALAIDPTRSLAADISAPAGGAAAGELGASQAVVVGPPPGVEQPEAAQPEAVLPEQPIPVRDPLPVTHPVNSRLKPSKPATAEPLKVASAAQLSGAVFGSLRFGLGFGTNNWLGPKLARQFLASVDAEPGPGQRWCLRATGYRGVSSADANGLRASFGVWGARLDAAPYVLGWGESSWRLALAGLFDMASLTAAGDSSSVLAVGQARSFLWLAVGALGRLQTPEWQRLRLEVQGELVVPLRRPEFNFQAPFVPIHTPPQLAAGAHLGLGVRLF
jgi:hypothetical protein